MSLHKLSFFMCVCWHTSSNTARADGVFHDETPFHLFTHTGGIQTISVARFFCLKLQIFFNNDNKITYMASSGSNIKSNSPHTCVFVGSVKVPHLLLLLSVLFWKILFVFFCASHPVCAFPPSLLVLWFHHLCPIISLLIFSPLSPLVEMLLVSWLGQHGL